MTKRGIFLIFLMRINNAANGKKEKPDKSTKDPKPRKREVRINHKSLLVFQYCQRAPKKQQN